MRGLLGKIVTAVALLVGCVSYTPAQAQTDPTPSPRVSSTQAVDWLFVFKLNGATFPTQAVDDTSCAFDVGSPARKPSGYPQFSLAYAFATSNTPLLAVGAGLAGTSDKDPLGATFGAVWASAFHYVIWNDQFYNSPLIAGCNKSCGAPWGHSKGLLVWNDAGDGMVLQVTTPSWPAAASPNHPRVGDGNTLGCVSDNDVKVSQSFFALKLSESDVEHVLDGLANASVVTNIKDPELVENGGPAPIQQRVLKLGVRSASRAPLDVTLSSGVRLISKPSALHVPPWQLVSAMLGGVDLRVASWWTRPAIPSTTRATPIRCWSSALGTPGAVDIATSGSWQGTAIGLKGGLPPDGNHGKVGVSTSGDAPFTIFGDMNQQGALSGNCSSSQNGRGGMFFVVNNSALHTSVSSLIHGSSAPIAGENGR